MAYLRYFKDKITDWSRRADFCDLSGSGIGGAEAILRGHMRQFGAELDQLLDSTHDRMWGDVLLLEEIRRRYGLSSEQKVLTVSGASSALWVVFRAILCGGVGDRVLVESPAYDPLFRVPQYLGASVDWLPREGSKFDQIDMDRVASLMTPRTKLVVVSNPHNPSGHELPGAMLEQLANAARRVNPTVKVLVDETFGDFLEAGKRPAAKRHPGFISVSSLSKVYGLGMLRCGWVIASGDVFEAIIEAWLHAQNIGSKLTESLATIVFRHLDAYTTNWNQAIAANQPLVADILGSFPQLQCEVPARASVCFPRVVGLDANRLVEALEAEGVGVIPGRYFNAPSHFRLGFGIVPEKLREENGRKAREAISSAIAAASSC